MVEQQLEEVLKIIKEVESSPTITQRYLSTKLGISLGKTNYLLRELIKKGWIKAKIFSHRKGKLKRLTYNLTKKGLEEKLRLTYRFLKRKEAEYNQIKKEWEELTMNNRV
jgi:EPS-associated MarR family transcriptional regulator